MKNHRPLKVSELRWQCPNKLYKTGKKRRNNGIVGQERAIRALRLGIEIDQPGYNIFVSGMTGTGRTTAVEHCLEELRRRECPYMLDRCYVYNFRDPISPALLEFPAGTGESFQKEMESCVTCALDALRSISKNEQFMAAMAAKRDEYDKQIREIIANFESKLKKDGFALLQLKGEKMPAADLFYVYKGQARQISDLEKAVAEGSLPEKEYEVIHEKYSAFSKEFADVSRRVNEIAEQAGKALLQRQNELLGNAIKPFFDRVKDRSKISRAHEFVDSVMLDMLENSGRLASDEDSSAHVANYGVNLLTNNKGMTRFPVVFEENLTYQGLFGSVEVDISSSGAMKASYMNIRAGSLLKADQGYIVIHAEDLFQIPGAWSMLKKILRTGILEISPPQSSLLPVGIILKPQPIKIKVKVILIGEEEICDILYAYEPDFKKTFKVKADFDSVMPLNEVTGGEYVSILEHIAREYGLPMLADSAKKAMIEWGVRTADTRGKISVQFFQATDVLCEAAQLARSEKVGKITSGHIEKAISIRDERNGKVRDKLMELTEEGVLNIETSGKVVGQVNGLSYMEIGPLSFGRPQRISVSVSPGRAGIINIEREAGLSGKIFDKAIAIIHGYMRKKYARDIPLSVTASICFEQSYSGIDGDSASLAEICALVSAIAEVPLKQSIAITGSCDQNGLAQAIGGVNEKTEGFFDLCANAGSKGNGVVIPESNKKNLMLKRAVLDACQARKFSVWTVKSIDDALEILTDMAANEVHLRAKNRIEEMAQIVAKSEVRYEG